MQAAVCKVTGLFPLLTLSSFSLYTCFDDTDDSWITHGKEIHGFYGKMNPPKFDNKKQSGDFFLKSLLSLFSLVFTLAGS